MGQQGNAAFPLPRAAVKLRGSGEMPRWDVSWPARWLAHTSQALQCPRSSSGNQPFRIPSGHKVMVAWLANSAPGFLPAPEKSNGSRAVSWPLVSSLPLNTSPKEGGIHWDNPSALQAALALSTQTPSDKLPKSGQYGKRKCVLLTAAG